MKRLGYLRVNGQINSGKTNTALFDGRESPSILRMLATTNDATGVDTELYYDNAGTWTEIAAAQAAWAAIANCNVEMETFVGYTFFVGYNGTSFLPVGSLTNTTFSTVTNVGSMAQGKFIRRYRDRLYVANCKSAGTAYPYRVYFSSVPTGAVITWDTTSLGFFDIDFSEQITGIEENWDYLIIFTAESAYYYNQVSKKKLWDIGCSNHRTIKNYSSDMLWADGKGVYVSTSMGRPQNIAGNVIDFVKAGTATNYFAELIDEEYHLFVGSVTVDGISYTNVDLIFNFPTQTWRWEELAGTMKIFAKYNSSGDFRLYMGDNNGQVWNKSKYSDASPAFSDGKITTVDGTAITVFAETKPFFFDNPAIRKRLNKVTVFADRALGVQMKMRALNKNTRALVPYEPLGQITKYINVFEPNDKEFNLLQLEITESSVNPYFSILGIVVEYEVVATPNVSKK